MIFYTLLKESSLKKVSSVTTGWFIKAERLGVFQVFLIFNSVMNGGACDFGEACIKKMVPVVGRKVEFLG